jgi:transcriptional antiterminator
LPKTVNELLDQIKISISLIYLYTKQQLLSQEEKYNVTFDENEIAYVAMYLASAFETSINLDQKIRVLIECSFGTTTSAILDSRIRQLITECEIVGPFSTSEAKEYLSNEEVDLVITTHDGSNYKYPTIIVNPLLKAILNENVDDL